MLIDGPAILGQMEIKRIDRETSAGALHDGLLEAMRRNEIKELPIDAVTAQLSGLFERAALSISNGESPEDHLRVLEAIFRALV